MLLNGFYNPDTLCPLSGRNYIFIYFDFIILFEGLITLRTHHISFWSGNILCAEKVYIHKSGEKLMIDLLVFVCVCVFMSI